MKLSIDTWNQEGIVSLTESKPDIWNDATFFLNSQMNMLLKNMALGFLLVFAVLSLFLRLRLATWVVIGLPVAFLGAFMMLPYVGVTINILSLFAFILVLGIVVDDAIIVGESAHSETESRVTRWRA